LSVPRWKAKLRRESQRGDHEFWSPNNVSFETAGSSHDVQKDEFPGSYPTLSTVVRSALRNQVSERCVSCVPSVVALRKPAPSLRMSDLRIGEVRTPVMRTSELRKSVMRKTEFAYPPASPRNTLRGVFKKMKRAARTKQFARMSERLAPQSYGSEYPRTQYLRTEFQRPASLFEPASWSASNRVRPSEIIRIRVPSKT
jgi:hypothetical protein